MIENVKSDDFFFTSRTQSWTKLVGTPCSNLLFFMCITRPVLKTWNVDFLGVKPKAYANPPSLPLPHQSMLGSVRSTGAQFQDSTLFGGRGGRINSKSSQVCQQFCPWLYLARRKRRALLILLGLSILNALLDFHETFRKY